MDRDSMVFYKSWLEAIKNLPREVQGDVLTAIVEYGLYGETTEPLKSITKAMLALVKPQIDANNQKYVNGCKGGEFGKLGGRPKKSQENPKETPEKPQENPSQTPNEYDNDNENDNDITPPIIPQQGEIGFPSEKPKRGRKPKVEFIPPALEEVQFYFQSSGLPEWEKQAEKFFNHWNSQGWKKGTGAKITNWDSLANNWILTEKEKRNERNQGGGSGNEAQPVWGSV
ncbi:DUF6291 domain-containing protein [Parabacteroides pacaensis]|uniref:DUF6291 domain-containing protein n=1 Tax=Parabacteroides pacaensis TaxID=2086575 RepID=UPI00131CFE86|nr:DUF6291 domain-containing protein [Parabacteroides pacaensis]